MDEHWASCDMYDDMIDLSTINSSIQSMPISVRSASRSRKQHVLCCALLQNYTLVSYSGTALSTLVVVSRPLDTCDPQDLKIYNDQDLVSVLMKCIHTCFHWLLHAVQ